MKLLQIGRTSIEIGKKGFVIGRLPGQELRSITSLLPRTSYDYQAQVNGWQSAIIMACIRWLQRTFPEAPYMMESIDKDGQWKQDSEHPLLNLLQQPNPYYDGLLLQMATIADFTLDGNAYWLKLRTQAGRIAELWWLPSVTIEPKWPMDGTKFIDYYDYRPGSATPLKIAPENIVHFRDGFDPDNIRKGMSPLKSLFREVFTDDEAANMTASLLKNMGVPGLVISPGSGGAGLGDVEATKKWFKENFTGDKRGEPLVMGDITEVKTFGFSPRDMTLKELRRIPEERITAVLGVPAIVAGMGAGLDRSCLPGDARVQMPDGVKLIKHIKAGDTVWSFKDRQIIPRLVIHNWQKGIDTVYEVRTVNQRVRLTGNHPVMVRMPGRIGGGGNNTRQPSYEWREAKDLKVGDYVIQAISYPDVGGTTLPDGSQATIEMLRFLGALIGDGTVSTPGVRMAMPTADRCQSEYIGAAIRLFDKQAKNSGGNIAIQERTERAPIAIQVREKDFGFASAMWARILTEWGFGGRAHTKRVPGWVFGLSRELRLAFLAGLVDADGSIDKRGVLQIVLCNKELIQDLRDLAVSCGLHPSSLRMRLISGNCLPNPGKQMLYTAWGFVVSSAVQVSQISFTDRLYRQRVNTNQHRHKRHGFDGHKAGLTAELGFFNVLGIKALGQEPVYDLTVEDGHSFFSENILVSNTYANYSEAREAAYESTIIPLQRIISSVIKNQLLSDFEDDLHLWRVGYDLSDIRILQEDETKLIDRISRMVGAGILKVSDAQAIAGVPVDDSQDYYLRPFNVIAVGGTAPNSQMEKAKPERELKSLDEMAKENHWRQYVAKAENYERNMIMSLRRIFREQKAEAIANAREGRRENLVNPVIAKKRYSELITPILMSLMEEAIQDAKNMLNGHKALNATERKQSPGEFLDRAALAWLKTRIGWAAEQVGEETAKLLANALSEGYRLGESTDLIAARVRQVFNFNDGVRAQRIARTETISASAQGTIEGYKQSGVGRLEFYASLDERTCPLCMDLHGNEFSLSDSVGVITVHPSCRCRWLPVIGGSP